MPNKVNLQSPPAMGDRTVYSFLWKLIEQLNVCLNQIDEDNLSEGVRTKLDNVFSLAAELKEAEKSADGKMTQLDKAAAQAISDSEDTLNRTINENQTSLEKAIEESAAVLRESITQTQTEFSEIVSGLSKLYAPLEHTHSAAYSTEETDTGNVWADGSRIYRKSFMWTGSKSNETITIGSIEGYVNLIMSSGFVKYGSTWSPINTVGKASESYGYHIILEITAAGAVNLTVGSQRTAKAATLTLWYTRA